MRNRGSLVLADGSVFCGKILCQSNQNISGEVVFVTAMTGYVEILTDPSYYNQIIVFSYPEIGNYGVNAAEFQSERIQAAAVVVRNLAPTSSNSRCQYIFKDWLQKSGVPIIYGVDTRRLIQQIRTNGAMIGALAKEHHASPQELHVQALNTSKMKGQKLSVFVCSKKDKIIKNNRKLKTTVFQKYFNYRVIVLDFGVKNSIVKYLQDIFQEIIIVPGNANIETIWRYRPCGVLLSNGPGDPESEVGAVKLVRALLGKVPLFGICLGHQILAQALGFSTYKLGFGHRGSNHSVRKAQGGLITTAQNHGFAVEINKIMPKISQDINISDKTLEGITISELFAFSVQFHPEGAPGPHDALDYFERFGQLIEEFKSRSKKIGSKVTTVMEQKLLFEGLREGAS